MRIKNHSTMKQTPVPKTAGYPNNVPNTQTVRIRGCGAATKGCGASKKMG
jgi:hypothetical protein